MTESTDETKIVRASRDVVAPAAVIFELIADPSRQPSWDGNANLAEAAPGQRVHAVGDTFTMTNIGGKVRENHVVEFVEGERIAWQPAEVGGAPFGQLWRWELQPQPDGTTIVTHTYDWTALNDPGRLDRARNTTADKLRASIDRLAAAAEQR